MSIRSSTAIGTFKGLRRAIARKTLKGLWIAAGAGALLTGISSAQGASATWNGTTDALWATDTNWSATPVPGTGDAATFNNAGGTDDVIDLGAGVTINNIFFDTANAAAYTVGSGTVGSQTLRLNNSGSVTMFLAVVQNQLFNSAFGLGVDATAGSYTFTNNSTTNSLTFAGGITGGTGGTAGAKTLTVTGAGAINLGGIIGNGGATSLALNKSGLGTLTLSGVNTYNGATTVSGGTLRATTSASALGAGTLSLGAGALQLANNSGLSFGRNTTVTASTSITSDRLAAGAGVTHTLGTLSIGAQTLTIAAGTNVTSGTAGVTFGATTLTGASTFSPQASTLLTVSTVGLGTNTLTKSGAGSMTASGVISGTKAAGSTAISISNGVFTAGNASSTFTGNIAVDGSGVFAMAGNTFTTVAPYGAAGNLYKQLLLTNGGTFRLTGGTFNNNNPTSTNVAAGIIFNIGSGGATFDIASGAQLTIDDGTGTGTAAGVSQLQGSGTITKTGVGTFQQDDSTAFAGAMIIAAGTFQPANANAGGATSAGTTIQSGARYNVNGVTMTNQEPLTINGTGLASAPAGALTNGSTTAATWVGPVTLGSAATIGSSNSGGLTLSSTATVNTAGNPLTIAVSGSGRIFTDGVISGTGTVEVNNTGTGDYVPRADHTYSGNTTLTAGLVAVDRDSIGTPGSPTSGAFGTGTLILAGGQIRSGTGPAVGRTIGNAVTISGDITFYTNSSEKNLTFSGPVTLSGGTRTLTANAGTTVAGMATIFTGDIGDGGNNLGLIKAGTGNLRLLGANTYTGGTTVNSGALIMTGSLPANTAVTVNPTVAAGAGLTLVGGGANPLGNVSTLTLGSATGTTFLGLDLGSSSDFIATPNAALASNTIAFGLSPIAGFGAGTYNLISAASGLTSGGAVYQLANVPGGYTYSLSASDTQVQLTATAAAAGDVYWGGAVNSSWSAYSAGTTNWTTDSAGLINAGFIPGSNHTVNFSATAAAGPTITTTLDNFVTVNDLKFSAAPADVSAVTINPGLTPGVTPGTLTIAPSSPAAGIALAQGAGAVTIAAPVILGASQTWSVDSSTPGAGTASSLRVTGAVSGTASLTFTSTGGSAPILLSAPGSTYSGGSSITAGTIVQGGVANGFSPNTAWTVDGTLATGAFNNNTGSLVGGSGIVQNGSATNATLTIGSDNLASATFAGTTENGSTGTLGITKAGTGLQILSGTNTYTGATNVTAGTLQLDSAVASTTAAISGGTLRVGGNLPATIAVTLSGTGTFDLYGASQTVASFTNTATNALTNSSTNTTPSTATAPGTPAGAGVYVDALTITAAQTSSSLPLLITDGPTRKTQLVINNSNLGTTFSLTNAGNTFSGGLVLAHHGSGTRLDVSAQAVANALGTGPIILGQVATDKAGIYFPTADVTLSNPIVFNTALGTDRVGIRSDVANITLSGVITANLAPATFTSNNATAGVINLTNQVTGPFGLVIDITSASSAATTMVVNLNNTTANPNNYQGDTVINANAATNKTPVLALLAADQIPNGAGAGNVNIVANGAGTGALNLNGFNETINGLLGGGTVDAGSGSPTLTLGDNNATASFSGTIAGTLTLTKIGSGTQTLSGGTSWFTGPINVNGGLIAFPSSPAFSGPLGGSTAVNLDGGGISYTASGINALNRSVAIGAGNGTIDVASSTGTLTIDTLTSTGGNLIKTGPGRVSISGTTTLNGGAAGVVVNGGTLQAGFGAGGISSISVGSTGALSFQNNTIEALALGNTGTVLSLSNGARLGFELDGTTNDSITVPTGGGLSLGGAYTFDFFNFGAGVTANTYTLLTAPAGSALNTYTYNLGNVPLGFNYSILTSDTMVQLVTTANTPIYWTGLADASLATAGNFTADAAGTTPAGHAPLATETVIFSAVSATATTANLDGSRTVDSLQFNGVPFPTLITLQQGSGGTLTLKPASASGGIAILPNGGNATISVPLALDNTLSASQTWSVADTFSTLTISGNVTFGANVNKSGAGTVILSGSNSGSGNFNLNAGALHLNSSSALGTGTLSIAAGTTLDNSSGSAVTLASGGPVNVNGDFTFTGSNNLSLGTSAITLSGNPTLTASAGTLTLGGVVGGTSGLTKAGAGVLTLNANNTFSGPLTLTDGTLNFGHAGALGTGTFVINGGTLDNTSGGALANANNNPITINGSFTFTGTNDLNLGTGAVSLTATPTVTVSANTLTIGGNITGGTFGLTKAGAGTLTLAGSNTYTGVTNVTGGTLNITGSITGNTITSRLDYGTTPGNTIVNHSGNLTAWVIRGANVAGAVSVFNQTAGTVTIVPTNSQDQQYLANNGGYGMLNITGGTFNTGRFDGVGAAGNASTAAVIYVGGSGTLNQNVGDWFLPIRTNGMMSMTVAPGGTFVRQSAVTNRFSIIGLNGTNTYGVFNVAGGTVDTGTKGINISEAGFSPGAGNVGFVNVAGGTLSLGLNTGVGAAAGTTNAYFNYAGGTLKATAAMTAVIPANTANYSFTSTIFGPITNNNNANAAFNTQIGTSSNFTGGMIVDTNGFNVTYPNAIQGAAGTFGVTQTDIGDLTLQSGNSGYVGAPMVQFAAPAGGGVPASGYALISGGQVTGIVITNPGTYAPGETPLITLTGGGGTIAPFATSALATANTLAGLTKNGAGTLTLSSTASTFTAPIVVNAGTLQWNGVLTDIAAPGAFGTGNSTDSATNAASVVLNGSTWSVTNSNISGTNRLFTVTQNGATLSADNTTAANVVSFTNSAAIAYSGSGARTLTFGGSHPGGAANANVFATLITDAGADAVTLQKTGVANWQLTNASNSYTGGTNIEQGILGFANGALGTTGNITFTGNATLQWAPGNNQDISGRLVMTNGLTSTLDTNGNDVALASALGAGGTGALTKAGAGTLTLFGANTYTGTTTIAGGTLNLGSPENPGTSGPLGNQLANAAGTILMTGGALQFSAVNTTDYSGRFSTAGSQQWKIDTNGQNITLATLLQGTGSSLTKLGAGTLTLQLANTYTGNTTIDQGTLVFAVDQNLAGSLVFGSSSAVSTAGTLDLTNTSATFAGALNVRTNGATANTITIGASETLTIGGGMSVGVSPAADGQTTSLTATGGGALVVGGVTSIIDIGMPNTDQNNAGNSTTVDFTGLGSFTANVDNFRIGWDSRNAATLLGSNTANSITANFLRVGHSNGDNAGSPIALVLGTGTNVINASTIQIGLSKATASIAFASQTAGSPGTLTIRGTAGGTSTADMTLGSHNGTGTAANLVGTLDLRGHVVDVLAGTVNLGIANQTGTGSGTGQIYFDAGTFAVNNLVLGTKTNTGSGAATGLIEVGGGSFTVNPGGSFTLGSQATAGSANATLNLTGGTFTSNVDIVAGAGTTTSTITLNGGTLDMTGKNIGGTPAIDNLNFQAGTLKNVASINGTGGLTKTTAGILTLEGTMGYTGATVVNDGTLRVNTSILSSSGVTVNAGTFEVGVNQTIKTLTIGGGTGFWSGKVDVKDNALVIQAGGATLANALDQAKIGRAGGDWNGNGIASSTAAIDPLKITGVGVIVNNNGSGGVVTASLDGQATVLNDILAKYTYNGDANLSGTVTADDYFLIDAGFISAGAKTGWYNGDFDYNGVIDIDDYFLIDVAYARQSGPLSGGNLAPVAPSAAVPEPGTLSLLALGAAALLGRRRRK